MHRVNHAISSKEYVGGLTQLSIVIYEFKRINNRQKRTMRKRISSFLLSLATVSATYAASGEVNINGDWLFHYAENETVADSIAATAFFKETYNAASFDKIKIPSCWAMLGYEEPVYRTFKTEPHSEGFYIKRFTLPKSFKGKRITLHFGGVWASAEVWLNGQRLGRHDSGYTSFSMPVTGIAKGGEENVLAVRVRQVYPGYSCDTYDDWSLGGIFRDVTLSCVPAKRWIDKVTAITKFDDKYQDADLQLGVMVYDKHENKLPGNYRSEGEPYQLHYTLVDKQGEKIVDEIKTVKGHPTNGRQYSETFHIKKPQQWNAETPNLYTLTVSLVENGQTVQTEKQKIGFREITTDGGVLKINGQAIKLRGVNRHDEWPDVGRATNHEHWLKDLTLMKASNINYVRACHYQHAKGFIELCDSIGMYVGAEISLGGAGGMMEDPQFVTGMSLRAYETVNRDINNPCIIYWSVGNEDTFNQMYYDAAKITKALDPTRPVLYPWCADMALPKDIDILAPHYWTSYEYDSLCLHSNRPIITTEYVHAYGTQRFGGLEQCFKSLHDNPHGAGGAVWMWADQGLVTPTEWTDKKYKSLSGGNKHLRISSEGWDGVTDSYRNPTRDLDEVKAVYAQIYPLNPEHNPWNGKQQATIILHNDHDFINANVYNIIYKVYVDKTLKHEGSKHLDIAPHCDAKMNITTGIDKLLSGQTAYVQLFFERDGKEMARKWVLLGNKAEEYDNHTTTTNQQTFHFENGFPIGLRPTIWHKINEGDQIIRGKIDGEKYHLRIINTQKQEQKDGYIVKTEAICEINDSNSVYGTYTFTVSTQKGTMDVDYNITPSITSGKYIPLVGMAIKAKPQQWLGLGPDEAYPNKKAAEILGVWDATPLQGTRAAQWVDTDNYRITFLNSGATYGFGYAGYIDRDSSDSNEFRLCSHILGRSEKGRLNDRNYRLEPKGQTYSGKFRISIIH